jgi:pyruvate kinase
MSRLRPGIPMMAFAVDPAIRRRMALTWGVQSTLVEHVAHTDMMFMQVDEFFLGQGLAKEGDKVVVISVPLPESSARPTTSGCTGSATPFTARRRSTSREVGRRDARGRMPG